MSNELDLFSGKGNLPDYINDFFDDEDSNIEPRVSVPTLNYGGKVWTVSVGGEKTQITKPDEDGEPTPVPIIKVVVLDQNKNRGRSYYEGAYDPDNQSAPLCWSDDGVKPDESVSEPQCDTCAKCPHAVKGSRVSENGKAVTACSQHRMLAVIPANALKRDDFPPLRMKIAITSDFDKQSPEMEKKGWRAWRQTVDFLFSKGAKHTAAFEMKMRFDPNVDYPKVMFQPSRLLEKDELMAVKRIREEHDVTALLRGNAAAAGVTEEVEKLTHHEDEDDDDEPPAKAAKAPKPETRKESSPPVDDSSDDDDTPAEPPKKAAKKEPAKKAAKPAPVEDEDEDEDVPEDMAALLGEWDE